MLVITRKCDEQITIGDNITISVLSVKGSTVRLGVTAPQYLKIWRTKMEGSDADTNDEEQQG
jgi:carbon storage regulator